jgi:hypothetical protein
LFDHGANPVEAGFNDGDDTVVATVPASVLVDGHYALARMVQTHSRFQVDARAHATGPALDGTVDDLVVMSDGTVVDGVQRDAGFFRFVFRAGTVEETRTGTDWPVPPWSTTAGAWATVEGGEWAVYFPLDLDVNPLDSPTRLSVVVNMDRAFRWVDSPLGADHLPGTWDVGAPADEAVMRFGGNRFDVTLR